MVMVKAVTSFGRSGLSDWLLQRFTALVLLAYTLCVGAFIVLASDLTYSQWKAFFDTTAMRSFSMLALLALVVHAWIGLWVVSTDYLTIRLLGKSATMLRLAFQSAYSLALIVYLVWGAQILWG